MISILDRFVSLRPSARLLRAAAIAALAAAGAVSAMPARNHAQAAAGDSPVLDVADLAAAPSRCRLPDASPPSRDPVAGTEAEAPARVALATTRCWWSCYEGSGCQWVCRFFPE